MRLRTLCNGDQETLYCEGLPVKNGQGKGELVWKQGPAERWMYVVAGYHYYLGKRQQGEHDKQPETVFFETKLNLTDAYSYRNDGIEAAEPERPDLRIVPQPIPISRGMELREIRRAQ